MSCFTLGPHFDVHLSQNSGSFHLAWNILICTKLGALSRAITSSVYNMLKAVVRLSPVTPGKPYIDGIGVFWVYMQVGKVPNGTVFEG